MSILAVTPSNVFNEQKMKYLLKSAEINRFTVDIIGLNRPFTFLSKILLLREHLADLPKETNPIICFTDAYDVFYLTGLENVKNIFLTLKKDIVFSVERWYSHQLKKDKIFFDDLTNDRASPYRYINTGTIIGYKNALLGLLDDICESIKDKTFLSELAEEGWNLGSTFVDQTIISHHLAKYWAKYNVDLDTACKIFYVPCGDWDNIDFYITKNMVVSQTGKTPCIIHVPWISRYEHTMLHLFNSTYKNNSTKKNLVYFSVFHNSDYFRLAELLLTSMRMYSSVDAFDILILTSPEFRERAEELGRILPLRVHFLPLTTIFQAACARLQIFDYPDLGQYNKILYLDTDIIIKKDLTPLFVEELDDVVYALESGTIDCQSFGSEFFDFNTIDGKTTAINSGTLLFKNCAPVRDLFTRIRQHVECHAGAIPACMDQPFINYHAIKDGLYNNKFLVPHVSLYENHENVDNYATAAICHFSFPIGNWAHKFARMSRFFKGLLAAVEEESTNWIEGKTLIWDGRGNIIFEEKGVLRTPWGVGDYEVLGPTRVRATWNNHAHVITFTGEKYVSLRIRPLDFDLISLVSLV